MNSYTKWVSFWGNAMSISENKPESYGKDITLRYPIYCPFNGDKIRLTFDNYCGTEPVTISKATIYANETFYNVYFDAMPSCTIEAGHDITSDPIDIPIKSQDTITVSFFLGEFTQLRSSVYASGIYSKGQYGIGDMTMESNFPIDKSRSTNTFYFLSNASIYTEACNHAVICYGDSITAQDWPDYMKEYAKERNINNVSFIRKATSGSRILREYSCITYESYGLKATNRFDHEIPSVDGADCIIIQQGINDIIHPVGTDVNPFRPMSDLPTCDELTEGLKWYIEKSAKMGLKTYLGTLLPIKGWRTYAPFREELKNSYNDWIRKCDQVDGIIDFDQAIRSEDDVTAFKPDYDSGDHLHPSKLGYKKMAECAMQIF